MRLITSQELSERTDEELQVLFNTVSKTLAFTGAQSPERRNALATLENIERARAGRPLKPICSDSASSLALHSCSLCYIDIEDCGGGLPRNPVVNIACCRARAL